MTKKRSDTRKFLSAVFNLAGLAMLIGCWAVFGPLVKGALSVKQLDEGIYYMEFKGDDGMEGLIRSGGGRNAAEISTYVVRFLSKGFSKAPAAESAAEPYGCAALTTRTPDDRFMMGRNFDFDDATALILHTRPRKGYESIATFNLKFFGFGDDWKPDTFGHKYVALTCLFFALDGINEKGLAIADLMAGDNAETHQDSGKPALTTTSALRYVLCRAATVNEAVELLRSIDMHSEIGAAHHYAISDASGRSVVVEYIDGELVVTDTPVVTNHYLAPAKYLVGLHPDDHRYDILEEKYVDALGVFDESDLCEAMESVSQAPREGFGGTQWTILWDLDRLTATYYLKRNYDKAYSFVISD
jgi:hypothetical protein